MASLKLFFSDSSNVNILLELENILKIESISLVKKGTLKNKTFMFTGKLDGISRAEAKSLIEKNSGVTLSNINKNLNYLVIEKNQLKERLIKQKY